MMHESSNGIFDGAFTFDFTFKYVLQWFALPDIANETIILKKEDFDNAQQLILNQMQNAAISHNKITLPNNNNILLDKPK